MQDVRRRGVYTGTIGTSDSTTEMPAMAVAAATNSSRAASVANTNLAFAGESLRSGVQDARRPPKFARAAAVATVVRPDAGSARQIASVTSMVTCVTSRLLLMR